MMKMAGDTRLAMYRRSVGQVKPERLCYSPMPLFGQIWKRLKVKIII
jgi:hypothetical protein